MGYYHRKIEKFIGRFPASMPAISIWQHYRMRDALVVTIFATGYVASLVLLLLNRSEKEAWTWLFYLLSVASGLVVLRITKVHLIELPQVLALREHPEVSQGALSTLILTQAVSTYTYVCFLTAVRHRSGAHSVRSHSVCATSGFVQLHKLHGGVRGSSRALDDQDCGVAM